MNQATQIIPDQQVIDQVNGIIVNHNENIKRLKATIAQGWWPKGYVENCQSAVAMYERQIAELKSQYGV